MPKPKGYQKREITDADRVLIEKMAMAGNTNDQMASILGMSPATFDKKIKYDSTLKECLERGRAKALFAVGSTAYSRAVSGKSDTMTIFFLKTKGGWKETQVNEHTGKDGEPLMTSFTDMVKRLSKNVK